MVDSKTFLIITNAGPSQLAGELCSPYVFSTSWQNDQTPQAIGALHEPEGRQDRLPDRPELRRRQGHAGGRARRPSRARSSAQELTKWPDQLDFSAELSKARAAKPDAIFAFYPGARRRPVPHAIRAVRPEGPDPALHRVHHRRAVAAAAEGPRARRSRRAAMGQRPAERRQQEVRRRLQGEVQGLRRRSTARRPTTPPP